MKPFTNINDPRVVKALAHPLRVEILGILEQRRASPSELAIELGAPLGNVSYHVRTLLGLRLIRLVKKTPRRGAVEHTYEAVTRSQISDDAWGKVPGLVKQALVSAKLEQGGQRLAQVAAEGGFDRSDAHLTRTPLTLDEQGWREAAELLLGVLSEIDRIQAESAARLEASDHVDERSAEVVMMLFETLGITAARDSSGVPAARRHIGA